MTELVQTEAVRHVAVVRLNRPEARNALSPEMMQALADELERLDSDPGVRCIVIAGSAEFFASGADLAGEVQPAEAFWTRLGAVEAPMVAAVSGWALGAGCELAFACDLVVASETAEFGQPEITLGLIPGGGATQRLTRAVGKQRAMDLVLTGRRFSAEVAEQWGLVNKMTHRNKWLDEAMELAERISLRPPIATRLAKQAILAADESAFSDGLTIERELLARAHATEDRVEAMQAMLEKRKPEFRGR